MSSIADPLDALLHCTEVTVGRQNSKTCPETPVETGSIAQLTWRIKNDLTFSDWTIIVEGEESSEESEVETGDKAKQDAYNVHRLVLVAASDYFRALFNGSMESNELKTSTSTFALHQKAREVFPAFLDYIYAPSTGLAGINESNAVALRYLAQYFGAPAVLRDATEFILNSISAAKTHELYIADAAVFNDDKVIMMISTQCRIHETANSVAEGTFQMVKKLIGNESLDDWEIFQTDKEIIAGWKALMKTVDRVRDPLVVRRHCKQFPDIRVQGAGVLPANGVYTLVGLHDGVGVYSNEIFFVLRFDEDAWELCLALPDGEWDDRITLYECTEQSSVPPIEGWNAACDGLDDESSPYLVQ